MKTLFNAAFPSSNFASTMETSCSMERMERDRRDPTAITHLVQNTRACCYFCCLGIAPRAKLLKESAWLLHQICDSASPTAHDSSEVAHALNRRCYPHTGKSGYSWCRSHGCCPVCCPPRNNEYRWRPNSVRHKPMRSFLLPFKGACK